MNMNLSHTFALLMRMFRSYLIRVSQILSVTAVICLLMMSITLGIQRDQEGMLFCAMLAGLVLVWLVVNYFLVKNVDPELSMEVARLLLPSGAILSIALSGLFATILDGMIPGSEGKQHYVVLFVGLGVAGFLIIRCFDIKWLRGEDEVAGLENSGEM